MSATADSSCGELSERNISDYSPVMPAQAKQKRSETLSLRSDDKDIYETAYSTRQGDPDGCLTYCLT
jgi:hypothetical protein